MKKNILLIAATHGNEKIGVEAIKILRKMGLGKYFDCLIANSRAFKANKRFVDFDMNRAYPGEQNSRLYEKRRAWEVLRVAKKYRYVIDLHEASAGQDDFIIVPRKKLASSFPLDLIYLKKILLWPDPKGPLGQVFSRAVELEFGVKNKKRKAVVAKAVNILAGFLRLVSGESNSLPVVKKQVYRVYGKLLAGEAGQREISKLADFKLARIGNESFYPLLVGQYIKNGIVCYKMRRDF